MIKKSWFWCPAVWFLMTHESFASSGWVWTAVLIIIWTGLPWTMQPPSVLQRLPGWEFPSCPSAPCWHLCLGKDPGLGSLLGLKAECLPQKNHLRLLMPYNLWLHKHFCFCGLGSSSQSEYSCRRGGRGRKCEECCLKCVTLQPSCARRGFVTEYFWIKLCWVISFINLHKNLMKKSGFGTETQKNKQLFTFICTVELLWCHFWRILFYNKEE